MSHNKTPAVVECPGCARMVKTVHHKYSRHSQFPTGPACRFGGDVVSDGAIEATRNVERARTVLDLAHRMREEDPVRVHEWIAHIKREELEALMCLALAAIPPDQSLSTAFAWVM